MTGRMFGFEAEYEAGGQTLLPVLYERGLTADPEMHSYHCDCGDCFPDPTRRNPFTAQEDCTVDIEIISKPLSFGSDEHFDLLDKLSDALREGQATPGPSAGNHVHVSREDMSPADHRRLYRMFMRYQSELGFIAQGSSPWVRDYNSPISVWNGVDFWNPDNTSDLIRYMGGSWLRRAAYTFEFRLWNSTRLGWRLFLHQALSVAVVDAAVAEVTVTEHDPRELPEVLEGHLHPEALGLLVRQLEPLAA